VWGLKKIEHPCRAYFRACVKHSHGFSSETGHAVPIAFPERRPTIEGAASDIRCGPPLQSPHVAAIRHLVEGGPRPLPRNFVGTCPVRQSTGSFDPNGRHKAHPR